MKLVTHVNCPETIVEVHKTVSTIFACLTWPVALSTIACIARWVDNDQRLQYWAIGVTNLPWIFYFIFSFLILFILGSICGLVMISYNTCCKTKKATPSTPWVRDANCNGCLSLFCCIFIGGIFFCGFFYFGYMWHTWWVEIIDKKCNSRDEKHNVKSSTTQQINV